ncbi:DUF4304 domain-containing protein [Variovorax ginsengisoli]|uniref:DUF4304 domain-containing protein n=1 Tax=Variovorax ginsengisoli TaxID=363844 RepID=A0ABT9S403_9BURK|nr:DUF4304 domain-containing protein [Variovorax ginsengisoli]MDP9899083.1 hypothetical protein [Variovorax ginsengisoli]
MTPSKLIAAVVRTHLKPFLTARGFTSAGSTFQRRLAEATQVVNVERSKRNGALAARFYINGSVYLPALDAVIGDPLVEDPGEPSCHVRLRPNDANPGARREYDVTLDTDGDALGAEIARDVTALLDMLDGLTTPQAAIAHLAGRKLAQYERVFGWYLSQNELDHASRFVKSLHAEFGGEGRWAIFARRLDEVERGVRGDVSWREWIG